MRAFVALAVLTAMVVPAVATTPPTTAPTTRPAVPILRAQVTYFGPVMPVGPDASGMMVMGGNKTEPLDSHILAVEVVHTDQLPVQTAAGVEITPFFYVRIRIDPVAEAAVQAIVKSAADASRQRDGMVDSATTQLLILADNVQFTLVSDPAAKTAELRAVLNPAQLLALTGAIDRGYSYKGQRDPASWSAGKDPDPKP